MEEAKLDRLMTTVFVFLAVVDIVVGAGFVLGADYFGLDPQMAWIAGGLFFAMGVGLLAFVAIRRGRRGGR